MKIYKKTKKTRLGVTKKLFVRKERIYIPHQNVLNPEFKEIEQMPKV